MHTVTKMQMIVLSQIFCDFVWPNWRWLKANFRKECTFFNGVFITLYDNVMPKKPV